MDSDTPIVERCAGTDPSALVCDGRVPASWSPAPVWSVASLHLTPMAMALAKHGHL